ncbi:MAG: hypothetical protein ACOZQL_21645 [Myxococcota bacterium]
MREWGFLLRNTLRFSLPAWKRTVSLASLRGELDAQRLSALERRFELSSWARLCNAQDWRESLYVLDVLTTHLPRSLPEGRALDVGSKNGAYLPGLVTAVPRAWDAVELDAHRRYAWGSTRRVYGERMAAAFPGCRFIAGDVRTLDGPWALVTWFLPFLTPEPLAAWGLPARALAPEALLRHVVARLVPGGVLLVVNQGEHEAELQQALFDELGLQPKVLGRIESPLSPFKKPRYGFMLRASPRG